MLNFVRADSDFASPLRRGRLQGRRAPYLLAALMLALALAVTAVLWVKAREDAAEDLRQSFDAGVHETVDRIAQRMATYEQVLRGAQGLFIQPEAVTRQNFRAYIAGLHLEERYPGIQGVALSLIVPPAQLSRHIAAVRAEGLPQYTIHPDGARDIYTSITQIEPFTGMNLRALGYDMFVEPVRRAAMEQARDSGKAAMSGKLSLIQELEAGSRKQPGFIMYLPLYRHGAPTGSVEQRRAAILGWLGAPFRVNDLMARLYGERPSDLRIRIYDGRTTSLEALMYDSTGHQAATPRASAVLPLMIAGRTWTVALDSLPAFEARILAGKSIYILAAGTAVGLLLAIIIWLLASGRARALALATGMTEELRASAQALRTARDELEARVRERTADLSMTNDYLNMEISERRKAESELMASRERLASIFDAVTDGLVVQARDGRFMELNAAAEHIIGLTAEQLAGSRSLDFFMQTIHEDGSPFPAQDHPALVSLRTRQPERNVVMGLRKNDGTLTWISVNTELLFDDRGDVDMVVSNFSDITQKKQSEELIWNQANYDTLTGLPNRRLFHDHLREEMKKSRRTNLPLAVMFIDLDHFKDINDTLGHDIGDVLLKEAAHRLCSCVREVDTVARLGGDEFTIILSELHNVEHIAFVAQAILEKLAAPFHLGIETGYVSASIGITLYPDDAGDIETLLKNADQAMYAAKNQGRNRYCHFTESMQQATQARMWLANELRNALAGDQFQMVYQPIVELSTGGVVKAEALLRWQHPTRGPISPAIFIPIAEETGMIIEIGDWVFRQVANQVKRWRVVEPTFQISINRSPVQFRRTADSPTDWFDYLRELGLPGQSIALEITEGLLLDASAEVTTQLLQFRDAGVQVSLDDFGTGYSSLAYLKKFDIDHLKIDQSFVRNLAADSDDMALCEAIIVMAHKLNIKVIAEGVETEQQRDLLTMVGCDYAQGFLFSKPVPAEEFAA
jgi:diguanylate cyclase (GGDEF)-like protein/PAS domain S-box-containing protein